MKYIGTASVATSMSEEITVHGKTATIAEHEADGTIRIVSGGAGRIEFVVAVSGD